MRVGKVGRLGGMIKERRKGKGMNMGKMRDKSDEEMREMGKFMGKGLALGRWGGCVGGFEKGEGRRIIRQWGGKRHNKKGNEERKPKTEKERKWRVTERKIRKKGDRKR